VRSEVQILSPRLQTLWIIIRKVFVLMARFKVAKLGRVHGRVREAGRYVQTLSTRLQSCKTKHLQNLQVFRFLAYVEPY
jgi:hypothetical protein